MPIGDCVFIHKKSLEGAKMLAALNRRSENVRDHPVIVAELELGNRHKGQSLGNEPDRHGWF